MYSSTVLTLGSLAAMVSASTLDKAFSRRDFKFPSTVPMAKRAVTGAEYKCHANCGEFPWPGITPVSPRITSMLTADTRLHHPRCRGQRLLRRLGLAGAPRGVSRVRQHVRSVG